jgi:hypothetical protein
MKSIIYYIIAVCFLLMLMMMITLPAFGDDLSDLLDEVGEIGISWEGFQLGKALSPKQKTDSLKNRVPGTSSGTYKFKAADDLFVIAHSKTDRVILLYEQHEGATEKKMREILGRLFFEFGDPTVMAHDKILYWVYNEKGKITEKEYDKIKAERKKLNVLASLKLSSSQEITDKSKTDTLTFDNIYYVISSDPILKKLTGK